MNGPTFYPLKGPGDFYAPAEIEPETDDASELAEQWMDDPLKITEAHEWVAGTMDADWYSQVEVALAELHQRDPDTLLGSDLLVTLYRLAAPMGEAIEAKINEMAQGEIERRGFGRD